MQAGLQAVLCHSKPSFFQSKVACQWPSDQSFRQSCYIRNHTPLLRQRLQPACCERPTTKHRRPQASNSANSSLPAAVSSLAQLVRCFNGPEIPGSGSNGGSKKPLPTQKDAIVEGPGEGFGTAVAERDDDDSPLKGSRDLDYLAVSQVCPPLQTVSNSVMYSDMAVAQCTHSACVGHIIRQLFTYINRFYLCERVSGV